MTSKDRVLSLCETHGIAISQLEKRLGYANNYFKRLKKEIPYDRAVAVAEFFGTSVDYILTGEQTPKQSTTGKEYYFNDETAQMAQAMYDDEDLRTLFRNVRKMPPEDLAALRTMTEALLRKEGKME